MRLTAVLLLVLLSPFAAASPPATNRPTADPVDAQDITDMAVDPTGQFAAAVVAYTPKTTAPGGLPLGGTSTSTANDVYLCDYGPADKPTTGTGCRGLRHTLNTLESPTPAAGQRVDATYTDSGGRQGLYAVAGPDNRISYWSHSAGLVWTARSDVAQALNITMSSDGHRVVAGVAATAVAASGSIEVRDGRDRGGLIWSFPLTSAAGANVRSTSLDYSRTGSVLAIGTTDGLLLANPDGSKPTGSLGGIPQAALVSEVALSGDGRWVVAAASNGVFLSEVLPGAAPKIPSNSSVFSRGIGTGAQAVAISVDGTRFAAAAGNEIHFFRRANTAAGVEPIGTYDAGARVNDLAYDEKGLLLVAVAGNNVHGFGPNKATPVWSFDGTQAAFGSLDGPMRRVGVSDDAQRVIVAGRTKTMAYSSVVGVTATLSAASGSPSIQPTQTVGLTLAAKNVGSLSDNYSFIVTPPVGWPSASASDIRLEPEESGSARINVTAPAGTAPGVYGVQVRVRSEVSDQLAQRRNVPVTHVATATFNLTIPRSVVLNVSAPDDRLLLRQGGEQTVAVTLRNEGNAEGVVNLSVRQELTRGASWDVVFQGGDQVRVPASSSTTVNMLVTAPSDAGSGDRNVITVRAREGETVEATDQVIAYVDALFGAELKANKTPPTYEFYPGQVQSLRINITNVGNTEDTFNLTDAITPASVASDWRVTLETPQITIARGQTKAVLVTVKAVASDAREASLTLRTTSHSSPQTQNTLTLNLLTVPRPPTVKDDDRLLPAPAPIALVLVLIGLALARRGGRR